MKILEAFFAIAYLTIILFLVVTKNASFIPYNFYIVQSGSMEPIIKIADMIVVSKQNDYYLNDVITYKDLNQSIVTHRIINKNNNEFTTKGDANRDQDREQININQIIGKVVFKIPFIGYLINFLQTKIGLALLVILPALYIAIFEITKLKNEKHK